MMNILLTNDDGIHAKGLEALYSRFSEDHSVTVIAPDRERSACGHGITLHEPLRSTDITLNNGIHGHAVNGTPVDCIKLAILEIFDGKPDLVISGINPGANTGVNINYSGTAAAAREAALYKIPAIAVSISSKNPGNYNDASVFTLRLAETVFSRGLPSGTILNVNIPDMAFTRIKGIKITRQYTSFPHEYIEKKDDPRERPYYWYGYEMHTPLSNSNYDEVILNDDFISITPIKCDMTDYGMVKELSEWNIFTGFEN